MGLLSSRGREYDRVVLLTTAEVAAGAQGLRQELLGRVSSVDVVQLDIQGGGDYSLVYRVVHGLIGSLAGEQFDVLISAGSPSARAVWLAMAARNEITGSLLQAFAEKRGEITPGWTVREVLLPLVREALPNEPSDERSVRFAETDLGGWVIGGTEEDRRTQFRFIHAHSPRQQGDFIYESCHVWSFQGLLTLVSRWAKRTEPFTLGLDHFGALDLAQQHQLWRCIVGVIPTVRLLAGHERLPEPSLVSGELREYLGTTVVDLRGVARKPLQEVVAEVERRAIAEVLEAHEYNKLQSARALGIDRNTLKRKMARYALFSEKE